MAISIPLYGGKGLEEEKGSMKTSFVSSALSLKFPSFSGNKKSSGKSILFFPQVFTHPSIRVCQILRAVDVFLLKPISVAISST